MAADTSSSAAARIPVVGAAAADLAALSVEPILARSVAAAVASSGVAITNDMGHLPPRHDRCVVATRNRLACIGHAQIRIVSRSGATDTGSLRPSTSWTGGSEPDRPNPHRNNCSGRPALVGGGPSLWRRWPITDVPDPVAGKWPVKGKSTEGLRVAMEEVLRPLGM